MHWIRAKGRSCKWMCSITAWLLPESQNKMQKLSHLFFFHIIWYERCHYFYFLEMGYRVVDIKARWSAIPLTSNSRLHQKKGKASAHEAIATTNSINGNVISEVNCMWRIWSSEMLTRQKKRRQSAKICFQSVFTMLLTHIRCWHLSPIHPFWPFEHYWTTPRALYPLNSLFRSVITEAGHPRQAVWILLSSVLFSGQKSWQTQTNKCLLTPLTNCLACACDCRFQLQAPALQPRDGQWGE